MGHFFSGSCGSLDQTNKTKSIQLYFKMASACTHYLRMYEDDSMLVNFRNVSEYIIVEDFLSQRDLLTIGSTFSSVPDTKDCEEVFEIV